MAKHEKVEFKWENPREEFYKERIAKLEKENQRLRAEIERKATAYGMGKDAFEEHFRVLDTENDELRSRVMRLEKALIREATRDV